MSVAPAAQPASAAALVRRGVGLMIIGRTLGVSLAALDLTIVATAVHTIADDLAGLNLQAWPCWWSRPC